MIDILDLDHFDAVVGGGFAAIVYFTSTGCAPCRWLKPYLIAKSKETGIEVYKVDIDADWAQPITVRWAVRSVPTLAVFRSGKKLRCRIGVPAAADMEKMLDYIFKRGRNE